MAIPRMAKILVFFLINMMTQTKLSIPFMISGESHDSEDSKNGSHRYIVLSVMAIANVRTISRANVEKVIALSNTLGLSESFLYQLYYSAYIVFYNISVGTDFFCLGLRGGPAQGSMQKDW